LPKTLAVADICFRGDAGHNAFVVITALTNELPNNDITPFDDTLTKDGVVLENASKFVNASRELYWVHALEYEVPSSKDMPTTGAGPVLPTVPDNVEPPG